MDFKMKTHYAISISHMTSFDLEHIESHRYIEDILSLITIKYKHKLGKMPFCKQPRTFVNICN